MQYPRSPSGVLLLAVLTVAAAGCGDNTTGAGPDAAPPGPDAAPPITGCAPAITAADLDGGTWDTRFAIPGLLGLDGHAPTLYDFAADTDGSIVAAGEFRYLGADRIEPLVRWRDGAWEPARSTWELEPPGSGFSAVAIAPDGDLALATYDDFGPRSGEIWLDDGTGLRVIGSFEGLVRTLAWYDGALWLAGWGVVDDGAGGTIQGLAVWDGTSWSPPPGGAPDGFAFELTLDGTALLVGGYFDHVGGIAAQGVARWNGTAWRAMNLPGGVGVYAIARGADNLLYAGGAFGDLVGGGGGLVRWNGTAWRPVGRGLVNRFNPGVVSDLVVHDGSLYASGCFRTAGGGDDDPDAIVSRDVIRWDGAWHTLDDDTGAVFSPWVEERACGDEGPNSVWDMSKQRLFDAGDRVFLAGSFPGIDGTISQALIAHDGTSWSGQGGGLGIGGSIDRIGVAGDSCELWGLGTISHVAGVPSRAKVVHFDGATWTPIAESIPPDAFCPAFAVSPLGDVALGCMEFPPAGDAVGRIYRVDGTALVAVDAGDLPPIAALAYDADGRLWIGGGGATGFVARLDRDAATATMIEDGFDGSVQQLDVGTGVAADDVIAGGYFNQVGSTTAARIARFDGTAWTGLGAGLDGLPTAIAHDATTVYVSTYDEGAGAYLLGQFDGTAWHELATRSSGLTPKSAFNFNALELIDGGIIAVGSAVLDDGVGRGALIYAGGQFRALGGGVHAVGVSDVAVTGRQVWVAGSIAEAGSGTAAVPTVGIAHYTVP